MLGNITEDQVGGDRRDLVKPGFAEFAFHVVFLGEGVSGIGQKIFRHRDAHVVAAARTGLPKQWV